MSHQTLFHTSARKLHHHSCLQTSELSAVVQHLCCAGLAEVCHKSNVPLIVDEAHGSHFVFDSAFPQVGSYHFSQAILLLFPQVTRDT